MTAKFDENFFHYFMFQSEIWCLNWVVLPWWIKIELKTRQSSSKIISAWQNFWIFNLELWFGILFSSFSLLNLFSFHFFQFSTFLKHFPNSKWQANNFLKNFTFFSTNIKGKQKYRKLIQNRPIHVYLRFSLKWSLKLWCHTVARKKVFPHKKFTFEFIDWFFEFAFSLKDRTCARLAESERGTHFSFAFCSFIYVYISPVRIFLHIAIFPAFPHIDAVSEENIQAKAVKRFRGKSLKRLYRWSYKIVIWVFFCLMWFFARMRNKSACDIFFLL